MIKTLEQAAKDSGLTDITLLKLVDATADPEQAVASLKARYPGAFQFNARTASNADYEAAKRELNKSAWERYRQERNARDLEKMRLKYEVKK